VTRAGSMAVAALIIASGCRAKDAGGAVDGDTAIAAGGAADSDEPAGPWPGGTFDMETSSVDDGCGNGAAVVTLMPDGHGVPYPWPSPVTFPDWEALTSPTTVPIDFGPPLDTVEFSVRQGDLEHTLRITGADQTDVLFDEDNFSDCRVDLSITAGVILDAGDVISGNALLTVTAATGETCPVTTTPCLIVLDFLGARR
jgi:hypothetical protein